MSLPLQSQQTAAVHPGFQLPLYIAAWVVTSLVVSEITISLSGPWQAFTAPQSHTADGPGLHRTAAGRSLFLPSLLSGLVLGLLCVGGWTGFLYALLGHLSHPGVGQRVAVGLLPYLVSGMVAGCVRVPTERGAR